MAKSMIGLQRTLALALALALATPIAAYANDKKHFKDGLKYEENHQWDKAAEQYALAVAEKPSNIEYQMRLQRALVSAAIMLCERGDHLAEQKDFNAAYQAYRQAYAFDNTNELALIKMRRMLEAQKLPTDSLPKGGDPAGPKYRDPEAKQKSALYRPDIAGGPLSRVVSTVPTQLAVPGRKLQRTDISFRDVPLIAAIEQLGASIKLNVLFDQQVAMQMKTMKLNVDMHDVSPPQALEMILKTNNLMYAQIDTRTIVVASDNPQTRMKYEPYALRTFYVKNGTADEMKTAVTGVMQQTKSITTIKQLNALVVRDTPSNLELIDSLIGSLDKSKAEVLIDVKIFEVANNDILKLGNQFATSTDTGFKGAAFDQLGGIGAAAGATSAIAGASRALLGPFGFALGLPNSSISIFQDKGKSKLLAATQIHVMDNENNVVNIGQRVPIQTASLPSYVSPSQTTTGTQTPGSSTLPNNPINPASGLGGVFGVGIPQIQYENVGLQIDMTPKVFEDEVEMKMKIASTSVDSSSFTPTFNQRTMNSVARVKDGQTTLVAGVSQNDQSKEVKGLPVIGLIPILGRLFATPNTTNRQSDVVITVTPHILRRADITDADHYAYAAGDATSATTQLTIEQILYVADQADAEQNRVAAAEGKPRDAKPVETERPAIVNVGLQAPSGMKVLSPPDAPGVVVQRVMQQPSAQPNGAPATAQPGQAQPAQTQPAVRPAAASKQIDDDDDDDDQNQNQQQGPVTLTVRPTSSVAIRGSDLYVGIIINGNSEVASAHITLTYDPNVLEIKSVRDAGLLRAGGVNPTLTYTGDGGLLNIDIGRPVGLPGVQARGQLVYIQFSVKGAGQSPLAVDPQQTMLRSSSGQIIPLTVQPSAIEAR